MSIRPNVFSLATTTGSTLATGVVQVHGFSVRENAGTPAAAVVNIFDNTADSGTVIRQIHLAASGSSTVMFDAPLITATGVRVQAASGSVEGTIYLD